MEHIKLAVGSVPMFGINISIIGNAITGARNVSVKTMLGTKCTHMVFFGETIVPPENCVAKLLKHDVPIASGCYPVYTGAGTHLNVSYGWDEVGGTPKWMLYWFDGTVTTNYCMFGCVVIRREVLERLEFPWFVWHPDIDPDAHAMGRTDESLFLERAKEDALVDGKVRCWNNERIPISATYPPGQLS